jgi:hypothetical protein
VVLPDIVPDDAVIAAAPAATPVASPLALTVTTVVAAEVHATEAVISCDVPSEYAPIAVNCRVSPMAMPGSEGVTVIDSKVAVVTVSVVSPETAPDVAVIFAVPTATPLARPAAFTVATPVESEDHVADAVISCDVPSE